MTRRYLAVMFCAFLLSACGWTINPLPPSPYYVTPSRTPVILTPNTATQTETPTGSATSTSTSAPLATATLPGNAELEVAIVGCKTSIDFTHQMGEVTNAYVTISNLGKGNLTNVCATLSASDEARRHPDKSQCVPSLPAGYQVTFKLTVDTGFKKDTSIQVEVTTNEGVGMEVERESFREIGLPSPNLQFGIVRPVP